MSYKIVIIGPVYPYRGGIAHFTTQLAENLMNAGHFVDVISFSRQYPSWLYPGKTDKDPSKDHPIINAKFLIDPIYPWTWFSFERELAKYPPNIVLIQWWTIFWGPAFFVMAKILKSKGIPVVYLIHNVVPHEKGFLDRIIAKSVLRQAKICITLSPKQAKTLHEILPTMRGFEGRLPIQRISNFRISKNDARKLLDLQQDEKVILFFGIIRPYKGLTVLLEALKEIALVGYKPKLIIAGEFWEDEKFYRRLIDQYHLEDQIKIENRFVPNEEVSIYFSAADLFVAPYLNGTQSAAIKVAMDFGLPVLASDSIISDLPREGYQLDVFPAGDPISLGGRLKYFFDHPPTPTHRMSQSNGWPEIIQLIDSVIDEINYMKN